MTPLGETMQTLHERFPFYMPPQDSLLLLRLSRIRNAEHMTKKFVKDMKSSWSKISDELGPSLLRPRKPTFPKFPDQKGFRIGDVDLGVDQAVYRRAIAAAMNSSYGKFGLPEGGYARWADGKLKYPLRPAGY
jgi:hypothetical protein